LWFSPPTLHIGHPGCLNFIVSVKIFAAADYIGNNNCKPEPSNYDNKGIGAHHQEKGGIFYHGMTN